MVMNVVIGDGDDGDGDDGDDDGDDDVNQGNPLH